MTECLSQPFVRQVINEIVDRSLVRKDSNANQNSLVQFTIFDKNNNIFTRYLRFQCQKPLLKSKTKKKDLDF